MTDAQEAGKMASEPESRCPICDWPIKKTIQEGCVPGNCSFRPAEGSPEYYRIQERRRQLEMDKLPRKPAAASEQPTAAPISQNRLSAMLYRSLERLSLAIEQCAESKPTTKEHHASIWSYLNEAQKDAKLKLKHYANFVAAPTAAPQVREVIVGLQENIEQLCALLLQRTGEDRGKLAAPTAAAESAPPDLNDAIAAIEEIVGSEELEEWGLEKANGKLSERELAMYERLSKAYQISHAFNHKHSCYKVHEDWRRLARAALHGEPGGEK